MSNRPSEYGKENWTELQGKINNCPIIVGNFNVPLSLWVEKPDRDK